MGNYDGGECGLSVSDRSVMERRRVDLCHGDHFSDHVADDFCHASTAIEIRSGKKQNLTDRFCCACIWRDFLHGEAPAVSAAGI